MKGRSLPIFERLYINGYSLNNYVNDAGERGVEHSENAFMSFGGAITTVVAGKPKVTFGPVNGVFDATSALALHSIADAAKGTVCNVLLARGVVGNAVVGDDAFCGPFYLKMHSTTGKGLVTATLNFTQADQQAGLNYDEFFGQLLHTFANETAANTTDSTDCDGGAETTAGGWLMYQISSVAGGGTATVSIDDSATGLAGSWAALAGATSGAISGGPTSGIVQLSTTATVRRYLRWQLALAGGATSCGFALAFMRGR